MTTEAAHYAFLKRHYKHDRFEGRNGPAWGKDYSHAVASGSYQFLAETGQTCVSRHESNTGEAIWYDRDLNILEIEDVRRRLTHQPLKPN